ncbi:MAG: hexosaminidase [Flavobacteriales bacterium]|jgi:hexosaminidase
MKRIALLLLVVALFFGCGTGMPERIDSCPSIIPTPSQMMCFDGTWTMGPDAVIYVNKGAVPEGEMLALWLERATGTKLLVEEKRTGKPEKGSVYLNLLKNGNAQSEAYTVEVHPDYVWITSEGRSGIFHAIQTFRQLAGAEFETSTDKPLILPCLMIEDHPKFGHRGLLLDCCRHFMEVDFVKRYIDLLAYHKMNTLHWHLTEDQGWRIEIEKYPALTEIGAWRTEESGERYGGFYTKEQIRDVVKYATERHITIIPEIELPGHSVAAIASYPELSCRGQHVVVENEWGVFKDIYCAGNDSVFVFLKDVLTEVMELFPSEYIHIGGDEAPKYRWENCDKCQKRIETMGLHDTHELQSWFISEIGAFLEENDRKLIGWDEILEGGIPAGAAVQSWRGMQGGVDAANQGHEVIMSPTSHCYFDYGLAATDLEEVYGFDPIPEGLADSLHHFIIGGECNMWTERAPQETVDSKVFPRILALSEVLWSYPENRDFEEFQSRVNDHYLRLDALGVDYGFESTPIEIVTSLQENLIQVEAIPRSKSVEISWIPGTVSSEVLPYGGPIAVTGKQEIIFEASWKGKAYEPIQHNVEFHQGLNHPFTLNYTYSPYYTGGGDSALVDGVLGSSSFRDGHWQALQFNDLEIVVDLEDETEFSALSSNFYLYNNAWIFLPQSVEYSTSSDGENWTALGSVGHDIPLTEEAQMIQNFELNQTTSARFVKMRAINLKETPEWHDSPGEPVWLFCDELVIRK